MLLQEGFDFLGSSVDEGFFEVVQCYEDLLNVNVQFNVLSSFRATISPLSRSRRGSQVRSSSTSSSTGPGLDAVRQILDSFAVFCNWLSNSSSLLTSWSSSQMTLTSSRTASAISGVRSL